MYIVYNVYNKPVQSYILTFLQKRTEHIILWIVVVDLCTFFLTDSKYVWCKVLSIFYEQTQKGLIKLNPYMEYNFVGLIFLFSELAMTSFNLIVTRQGHVHKKNICSKTTTQLVQHGSTGNIYDDWFDIFFCFQMSKREYVEWINSSNTKKIMKRWLLFWLFKLNLFHLNVLFCRIVKCFWIKSI